MATSYSLIAYAQNRSSMTPTKQRRAGEAHHVIPIPDPTQRTLEVLEREMTAMHEKLDTSISALGNKLDEAMEHRADLTEAKFLTVSQRFDLEESWRIEQKRDSLDSLAAALSAAKEAVKEQTNASEKSIAKSETSTNEAIKQLVVTFTAAIASVERAVSDLKERVVSIESQKAGAKDNTAALYAAAAALVGVVALIVAFVK